MILRLTPANPRLALRIKETGTDRQVTDWRQLQLLITPGQIDTCCGPNGSPWILTGCWPGHRTGVDVANFRPDFPPIVIPAFEQDLEGRIVFRLAGTPLYDLPPGRYTGTVRLYPHGTKPVNLFPPKFPEKPLPPPIPHEYMIGAQCDIDFPQPPPPPPPPPPCCVLSVFDIDLGPECSDHLVDQAAVEYVLTACREND